jgi:hypothetical protein
MHSPVGWLFSLVFWLVVASKFKMSPQYPVTSYETQATNQHNRLRDFARAGKRKYAHTFSQPTETKKNAENRTKTKTHVWSEE